MNLKSSTRHAVVCLEITTACEQNFVYLKIPNFFIENINHHHLRMIEWFTFYLINIKKISCLTKKRLGFLNTRSFHSSYTVMWTNHKWYFLLYKITLICISEID